MHPLFNTHNPRNWLAAVLTFVAFGFLASWLGLTRIEVQSLAGLLAPALIPAASTAAATQFVEIIPRPFRHIGAFLAGVLVLAFFGGPDVPMPN